LSLYHLRVGLKHGDITHDVSLYLLVAVLLLCLHNLDDMGLDDESALLFDSRQLPRLILSHAGALLLDHLNRHEVHPNRR